MSITNRAIGGTIALGMGNIALRVISFFTVFITVRAISVKEYGLFALFTSLAGTVTSFSGGGTEEMIVADTAKNLGTDNKSQAKNILWGFFKWRIILMAVVLAAGVIFRNVIEVKYGAELMQYFWIFVIYILINYFKIVFGLLFQIYEKFKMISLLNVLDALTRVVFISFLALAGKLTFISLVFSYIAGGLFTVLILLPQFLKIIKELAKIPIQKINIVYRIMRGHGKWQIVNNLSSSITTTISYWFINFFISIEAVAIYAIAQKLYAVLVDIVPLKAVVFPIIAKNIQKPDILSKIVQKTTKYALVINILFMGGAIIASPLIPIAFPDYGPAVPLFQLLLLRLLIVPFSITLSPLLLTLKEQKFLFYFSLLTIFSKLVILPFLLQSLGVIGAIIEILFITVIMVVLKERRVRKVVKIFDVKAFFKIDNYDKMILRDIFNNIKRKFKFRMY